MNNPRSPHRSILVAALAVLLLLALAVPALAGPPVRFAPGGDDVAHPHHVVTGSGRCQSVHGPVFFTRDDDRGMHRAALSSGQDQGPWHGACP
jgi:hypothetical protein